MRGTSLLAHEISADDAGGAALSFNAVDEHTLRFREGFLDELEYFMGHGVLAVKDNLCE